MIRSTFKRPLLFAGVVALAAAGTVTAQNPVIDWKNIAMTTAHGSRATMWAGGNHMSQTNRPLPQTSFGAMETNNNARYKVVPIGVLPGKTTSFLTTLRAVNNIEHVTGYSYVYTGDMYLTAQGFIWQQATLKPLPLLNGWPGAFAYGINDRDQVVGTANNIDSSGNYLQTAVLWDHGQPVNLGALQPGWVSEAFDVNIWGVAVGRSGAVNADFNTPVAWYGGKIHALPLLPGFNGAFAWKINDLGVISGRQRSEDFSLIPCIWYWNGTGYTAVNLGSFGLGPMARRMVSTTSTRRLGTPITPETTTFQAFSGIRSMGCKPCRYYPRTQTPKLITSTTSAKLLGIVMCLIAAETLSPNGQRSGRRAQSPTFRHSFPQAPPLSHTRREISTIVERSQ